MKQPDEILQQSKALVDDACKSLGDCGDAERDTMEAVMHRFKKVYLAIVKIRAKDA